MAAMGTWREEDFEHLPQMMGLSVKTTMHVLRLEMLRSLHHEQEIGYQM